MSFPKTPEINGNESKDINLYRAMPLIGEFSICLTHKLQQQYQTLQTHS